jgi:hypothetical protein
MLDSPKKPDTTFNRAEAGRKQASKLLKRTVDEKIGMFDTLNTETVAFSSLT